MLIIVNSNAFLYTYILIDYSFHDNRQFSKLSIHSYLNLPNHFLRLLKHHTNWDTRIVARHFLKLPEHHTDCSFTY